MANDIKLQEGHPVDENLRPIKVGGESTSLEVALERNEKRDRTVPRADAIKNWNIVQSNMGKFQKLFQPANFYVVDNSRSEKELVTATLNRCASIVRRTMKSPHNFIAKQWINRQLRIKKGDINSFFKGKCDIL